MLGPQVIVPCIFVRHGWRYSAWRGARPAENGLSSRCYGRHTKEWNDQLSVISRIACEGCAGSQAVYLFLVVRRLLSLSLYVLIGQRRHPVPVLYALLNVRLALR